ncbi:MAG: Rdx family protein [Gaiellaceae bacterium]
MERETGATTELVEGDSGQFDVEVDGRLIFSKWKTNRFPEEGEILAALEPGA